MDPSFAWLQGAEARQERKDNWNRQGIDEIQDNIQRVMENFQMILFQQDTESAESCNKNVKREIRNEVLLVASKLKVCFGTHFDFKR